MCKSAKLILFALVILGLELLPGVGYATPDNYIGDSAIYVGAAEQRARPNVLFVLDTSLGSLDPAGSGSYVDVSPFPCTGSAPATNCSKDSDLPYNEGPVDPFDPEQIYESSVTGAWTATSGLFLTGVDGCVGSRVYDDIGTPRTDYKIVQFYLATYGTYTGVGDAWYPSLTHGSCDTTSGKGGTYATGDYLNFVKHDIVIGDGGMAAQVLHSVPGKNKYAVFSAKRIHDVPEALVYVNSQNDDACNVDLSDYNGNCSEPQYGANDTLYWTKGATYTDGVDMPDLPRWSYGTSYAGPAVEEGYETQREVFYEALKTVLISNRADINFGVMTYNYSGNQGGKIIEDEDIPPTNTTHVQDLRIEANLNKFLNLMPKGTHKDSTGALVIPEDKSNPGSYTIADGFGPPPIRSGPQRPLAEAMYDAGAYFKAAYPGTQQNINETKTIDDSPDETVVNCDYNHIIMITNGLPNAETKANVGYVSIGNNGDWNDDHPDGGEDTYGQGTHYLDDVTGYLHDTQNLTIYTVLAFQGFDSLLNQAAIEGGSDGVYLASGAGDLADAFDDIFNNIVAEKDTAFVAPVVPASTTNRTISSNRVYLGLFKPQTKAAWRGNVKKYQVSFGTVDVLAGEDETDATDSDGAFIESSKSYWGTATVDTTEYIFAAEETKPVPRPALRPLASGDGGIVDAGGVGGSLKARLSLGESLFPRKLFTYVGNTKTDLREDDGGTITYIDSGELGTTDAERTLLVDWLHGYDAYNDGHHYDTRNWLMGDVLHSRPLVFNYGNYADDLEDICEDDVAEGAGYNSSLVFVGGNDGMLHAFRDCDGKEVWGFVPPMLLPNLQYLPKTTHYTYVDGAPTLYVHDTLDDGVIDIDQGDKVILLFGLRRGGGNNTLAILDENGDLNTQVPRGAYYALDVTDPDIPVMLWEITSDREGYAELAETWSQPRLGVMKDSLGVKWVVALVTAGYDQNEDLRWGDTQTFPDDTDHETDTTESTLDGGAVTSSDGIAPYNPKGRGLFAIKLAWLEPSSVEIVNDAGTTVIPNKVKPNFSETGDLLWKFTYDSNNSSTVTSGTSNEMTYSFPSDMTALDLNGDGLIDRIYVADTGGRMWRFDDNGNPYTFDLDGDNAWTGQIIFSSNPGYSGSLDVDGNYVTTADSTNGRKIFYKPAVTIINGNPVLYFGTGDREHPLNYNVVDRVYSLTDRGQNYSTVDDLPNADADGIRTDNVTEAHLIDLTNNTIQNGTAAEALNVLSALASPTNFGWYIKLENTGEKSLAAPVVFAGQAFYTTYAPNLVIDDPCEVGNLGKSRLYHLDYEFGEAVYNYVDDSEQTANSGNARSSKDNTILLKADRVKELGEGIPSGIVTLIDASGKVTMMISASNKVGTYKAPDTKLITPVYYIQWDPQ
jgi:type IV pilus assembly protein PilY1